MVIHATLAAARVKKVAAGKRYVLCGDFNVKPYDACYQLLTQGFIIWRIYPIGRRRSRTGILSL